jgi:menaquinone-9 beta-reductase
VTSFDVGVVGGGPAGLAVAIEAATGGLSAVVLERQAFPVDKACGEGLMPAGLVALERLGVLPLLDERECAPFHAIRWIQENGRAVTGALPGRGGLGIRRLELSRAMAARARAVGVTLFERTALRSHAIEADRVRLDSEAGEFEVKVLVAADGLHSPLRKAEGFAVAALGPRRFGLRRHLRIAWAPRVEVHFAPGVEAYVTPAGRERVGVAFLWADGALAGRPDFGALLEHFPVLARALGGAPVDSEARGAGPLLQRVARRVKDRFVLLGDAAGSVDAITGEGLSLGLRGAHVLAGLLPGAVRDGCAAGVFAEYERAMDGAFSRYARLAGTLVWIAGRPALRRFALDRLAAAPAVFEWALGQATGAAG